MDIEYKKIFVNRCCSLNFVICICKIRLYSPINILCTPFSFFKAYNNNLSVTIVYIIYFSIIEKLFMLTMHGRFTCVIDRDLEKL